MMGCLNLDFNWQRAATALIASPVGVHVNLYWRRLIVTSDGENVDGADQDMFVCLSVVVEIKAEETSLATRFWRKSIRRQTSILCRCQPDDGDYACPVSYVHDLDPNTGISNGTQRWEIYDNKDPKLMLFDDNVTSDLEDAHLEKGGNRLYQLVESGPRILCTIQSRLAAVRCCGLAFWRCLEYRKPREEALPAFCAATGDFCLSIS